MAPKRSPKRRPTVSIVGVGNLGSALAITLFQAGYPVTNLVVRASRRKNPRIKSLAARINARVLVMGAAMMETDIVWLTVPDDIIGNVAAGLAKTQKWRSKIVFHSSGALTSDELLPLREEGARVASVHPMMTFVRGEAPEMTGVSFALEGDVAAVKAAKSVVAELGGKAFAITKRKKALYHAFGSFISPMVIALMSSAERVGLAAGIPDRDIKPVLMPLLWQTLRNYLKKDAASAFSGPLRRGDVATIRKHLEELKRLPEMQEVYLALCKAALKTLPVKNRRRIEQALR